MMAYRYFMLLVIACFAPIAAGAQVLMPPDSIRRGEPGFAAFIPAAATMAAVAPAASDYTLSLRYADGSKSPDYRGFPPPQAQAAEGRTVASAGPAAEPRPSGAVLFLFSAPVDVALGEATMMVYGKDGAVLSGGRFSVADRVFIAEDLKLDAALTGLRVDPDPAKTEQAKRYQAVLAFVDPAAAFLDGGFVRPVQSERRTSLFASRRRYLYAGGASDITTHFGIDYGSPKGSPVVAAGSGRVVMAEDRIVTGNTVVIEHLPGTFTIYMHLDSMAVAVGAMVGRGAPIGTVGMTGLATGPHLHWEFRVMGVACDPEALVGLDKIPTIRTIVPTIEGG